MLRANHSRSNHAKGFTMIEIVVVLLVIGILAVLIVNSLQSVQAKTRDTTRRAEIDNIAKQLEACYDNKDTCSGAYPSLIQLTDTSPNGFANRSLPGFNNDWLTDSSRGSIQGDPASAATQYQYTVTPTGCSGTGGDSKCQGFTLSTYQETNPDHPYVKESLNK